MTLSNTIKLIVSPLRYFRLKLSLTLTLTPAPMRLSPAAPLSPELLAACQSAPQKLTLPSITLMDQNAG